MPANVAQQRDNRHAGLEVTVEERNDEPGVWTVEAIDMTRDGEIYQTFFAGPKSRERAEEYARFKYSF